MLLFPCEMFAVEKGLLVLAMLSCCLLKVNDCDTFDVPKNMPEQRKCPINV